MSRITSEGIAPAKPRILIVEDEGIIARDIQKILLKLGYQVSGPAGTGAEALATADTERADLVLMDIKIRGPIDGVETADQIRKRHRIPVIFLTAHADSDTLQRATATEPYGYVVKPFTEASIKVAIEVALNRKRLDLQTQARQDWLGAALESVTDAVISANSDGNVEYLNAAAERLTGLQWADVRGHALSEILEIQAEDRAAYRSLFNRPVLDGQSIGEPIHFHDAIVQNRSGDPQKVWGSVGPLHTSDGKCKGIIAVLRPTPIPLGQKGGEEVAPNPNAKLQELSYALSHDLREPLRNMACFAQMLSRQNFDGSLDPRSQEYLRFIVEGSKRMDDLLLGLARYHAAGERRADRQARANASHAWAEAVVALSNSIRLSGTRVQAGELPEVGMDLTSLKEVFEALLSNALRFRSGPHSLITAEARRDGERWRFTIADNGMGLDAGQAERVFGLFKKAHHQGLSGAGIGLAVCRRLIELYGGNIWLDSVLDKGTRVHFTAPAPPTEF